MKKYILKNGIEVEAIPIGRSSVKIGEISPEGMLTVCDRGPNLSAASKGAMVICQCKCGNYTLISLNSLRTNHVKSCGCYNEEFHRESCKKLGKQSHYKDYTQDDSNPYYKFIKRLDEKDSSNSAYWEVECKYCGKRYKAVPAQLISLSRRGTNPCDCLRFQSKGVLQIQKLLNNANINYITEKTFEDCRSPKGNLFKFDFWVNNEYLIEYDGEQHFLPESFGGSTSGEDRLKQQQEYDNLKNIWCKSAHIPLIRIPYSHLNDLKLEDLMLTTTQFIIN